MQRHDCGYVIQEEYCGGGVVFAQVHARVTRARRTAASRRTVFADHAHRQRFRALELARLGLEIDSARLLLEPRQCGRRRGRRRRRRGWRRVREGLLRWTLCLILRRPGSCQGHRGSNRGFLLRVFHLFGIFPRRSRAKAPHPRRWPGHARGTSCASLRHGSRASLMMPMIHTRNAYPDFAAVRVRQ